MGGGEDGERRRRRCRAHWHLCIAAVLCLTCCVQQANSNWWFLSQLQMGAVGGSQGVMCDNIPGLIGRQRQICQRNPDVMVSIGEGAKYGLHECQHQFRVHRWNCSTVERDATVFGKVMLKVGSREAAFVYSISSAGVVHSVTRACSKGHLLNCACDPSKMGPHRDRKGEFTWGGCSDNVRYGSQFSRIFIDAKEKKQKDARALMNLHNNRAGRKAVQKHTNLECKCHGVSGACTIRTCWRAMLDFRDVGQFLKKKYLSATEVMSNQEGSSLILASHIKKKPTKLDLIFLEESPDYCVQSHVTGSIGTAGRECVRDAEGPEGCHIMCCGRGYDTKRVLRKTKCECKFHWCCYVQCRECEEWVDVHTCKAPKDNSRY